MRKILFFGDSLTAGYGLNNVSSESLPALLQAEINREGLAYQIINAGISGETSSGGLRRIDSLLHQPIDVFVLELGINDIIRGISPEYTLENLQAIVDKVKSKYPNVKMLLLGMQIPSWVSGKVFETFNLLFRKLATENEMLLIPFLLKGVVGMTHLNLKDGFHPSAEGYKVVSETVWPELKQLLTPAL